jgi:multiple sugar transport system substrate-binding protein
MALEGRSISRRRLLHGTAVGVVAGAILAACQSAPAASPTAAVSQQANPTAVAPTQAAAAPTQAASVATPAPSPTPAAAAAPTQAPAATTAPTGEAVTVTLLQRNIPQDIKYFQGLATKFQDRNPSITLKIEVTPDDFGSTLQARLAAGTAGDMARNATHYDLAGQFQLGLFKPVDEFVKADNYDLKQHFDTAINAATVKGQLICLPWNVHPGWDAIYYLKGLFDKEKVPYPTDNWTYDDLTGAAKKLTKTSGGKTDQYGLWVAPFFEAALTPVTAFGGWYQNEDGTKPAYTDPKTVAGIQWQRDVYQTWKVSPANPDFDTRVALWSSNKVAMVLSGIWETAYLGDATPKGEEWGVARGPKGAGGELGGYFGCNVYPIWKTSKHPQQAWQVQKFLATKEVGLLDFDAGLEPGGRPDVWDDPKIQNDPRVKPHADGIKVVKPMPVPANGRNGEMTSEIQKTMTLVWTGEKSVADGTAEMQKAAEKIMAEPPPGS